MLRGGGGQIRGAYTLAPIAGRRQNACFWGPTFFLAMVRGCALRIAISPRRQTSRAARPKLLFQKEKDHITQRVGGSQVENPAETPGTL